MDVYHFSSPIGIVECGVTGDKTIYYCKPSESDTGVDLSIGKALYPELADALAFVQTLSPDYHIVANPPHFAPHFWSVLAEVTFGSVVTYGELAQRLRLPKGYARVIGNTLGKNDNFILLPCHRVIRSDGTLGGFRWGIERKKRLLEFEANGKVG